RIVSEGLSVRATEEIVMLTESEGGAAKPRKSPRAGTRSEAVDELATRLSDRFETRVKVSLGKTKGRMTVEFASVEDLNRILQVMAPEEQGLLKSSSADRAPRARSGTKRTDDAGRHPGEDAGPRPCVASPALSAQRAPPFPRETGTGPAGRARSRPRPGGAATSPSSPARRSPRGRTPSRP